LVVTFGENWKLDTVGPPWVKDWMQMRRMAEELWFGAKIFEIQI